MAALQLVHKLRGWLWDHLQLYRLARIGANMIANILGFGSAPIEHRSKELYRLDYSPQIETAWDLSIALLVELDRVVEMDGAQFVVVGISDISALRPTVSDAELDWELPNRELGQRLAGRGITYFDLLPAFQAHYARTGEKLYWLGDKHWNAAGHRLAARTVCLELDRLPALSCKPVNRPWSIQSLRIISGGEI